MRSIDLGIEERVRTYAELDTFGPATTAHSRWPKRPSHSPASSRGLTRDGGFASLEEEHPRLWRRH